MGTLSYSYGKPYGFKGEPGTCLWCGEKMRPEHNYAGESTGYRDNGFFCSLRCGYQWAVLSLQNAGRMPQTRKGSS